VVAIGMALIWAGYAVSIWGYCLVVGYDVSFGNVFAPVWPGVQVSQGTPGQVVLPGGHRLGTVTGPSQATVNPGQL
jgi:hypothetical protein